MVIPARVWKLIPGAAIGAAAFTLYTQTAYGFFPPIPNTPDTVTVSPPPPPPVVVPVSPPPVVEPPVSPPPPFVPPPPPPPVSPPPVVPPVPPPPFVPPPPPPVVVPQEDPPCDCYCHPTNPTPQTAPEPATIVSGLLGLSILGGVAWRRRKGKSEQAI